MPDTNRVFFLAVTAAFALTACGPMRSLTPVAVNREASAIIPALPPIEAKTLEGYRVDNVMLLYFREGMSAQRWTEVFQGAAKLAKKQREQKVAFAERLRLDPEAEPDMGGVSALLALIDDRLLSSVGNFSLWSSAQADCRVQAAAHVQCSSDRAPEKIPFEPAPTLGDFTAKPADLVHKIFLPYFSSRGTYSGPKGEFSFEMQLRPEPVNSQLPDLLVLKGDLILDPGYRVLGLKGEPVEVFRYGYAEISLRRDILGE